MFARLSKKQMIWQAEKGSSYNDLLSTNRSGIIFFLYFLFQARNLLETMLSHTPQRRGSMDSVLGRAFFAGGASVTAAKMQVCSLRCSVLVDIAAVLLLVVFVPAFAGAHDSFSPKV